MLDFDWSIDRLETVDNRRRLTGMSASVMIGPSFAQFEELKQNKWSHEIQAKYWWDYNYHLNLREVKEIPALIAVKTSPKTMARAIWNFILCQSTKSVHGDFEAKTKFGSSIQFLL